MFGLIANKAPRTVDSVMAAFNKTIAELQNVAEEQQLQADMQAGEIANYRAAIEQAEERKRQALAELERAQGVTKRMQAILGSDQAATLLPA